MVPENVRDQLTLWFQETKKARVCDAKLYTNFESVELFEKTVLYAKKIKGYGILHCICMNVLLSSIVLIVSLSIVLIVSLSMRLTTTIYICLYYN